MYIHMAHNLPPMDTALTVGVGSTVEMLVDDAARTWTIVPPGAADPAAGTISSESPLAKMLFGLRAGQAAHGFVAGRDIIVEVKKITKKAMRML